MEHCSRAIETLLVFSIAFVALNSGDVHADLPVHCVHHQVIKSEWTIVLSASMEGMPLCGHQSPDSNEADVKSVYAFPMLESINIFLENPDKITQNGKQIGTFTMVYDQGIHLRIGHDPNESDESLLQSLHFCKKYNGALPPVSDLSRYHSFCDRTMPGWYFDDMNRTRGCFQAHMKELLNGRSVDDIPLRHNRDHFKSEDESSRRRLDSTYKVVEPIDVDNDLNRLIPSEQSVMRIGDVSPWQPGNYEAGATRLNQLLKGRPRYETLKSVTAIELTEESLQLIASLPKQWDWRERGIGITTDVQSQGQCGSCFAIALGISLQYRVEIKSKGAMHPRFSLEDMLCSPYNQGCDGGYPFLVAMEAASNGLVDASCSLGISSIDHKCEEVASRCNASKRYFIQPDYHYVGGFYGAGNEAYMMKEIFEHGPIAVAFEAPPSLSWYSSGVFTAPDPPTDGEKDPGVNSWMKTNHAVVCIGWGQTEVKVNGIMKIEKYWILQNSWGSEWGQNGFFYMRRGTNEAGIETMAISVTPIISA